MHSDLDAVVLADEEARSRVALAEERRERELAAARAARDAAIDARRGEAASALARDLESIRAEGEKRVAELQRQQEQFLAALTEAGERKFDEGLSLFRRIVCEVAS